MVEHQHLTFVQAAILCAFRERRLTLEGSLRNQVVEFSLEKLWGFDAAVSDCPECTRRYQHFQVKHRAGKF